MADPHPWRVVADGLSVDLQVTPGAKADRVDGIEQQADGAPVLRVRIKAPPADGKANQALIKLLAKRWGLAKSAVTLTAGAGARRKRLHLAGDPDTLAARLAAELPPGGQDG
ncbi:DUF167 family protein [Rhodovibrio salinarum]|uniref:UPF0235 protein CKO21_06590 n=1 Tax=Rhodovibrio salinarum TaxID=1087 RepID=A0A934UZV2_9PROT|nr:DUF167 family protein [Rhodovibrio salinarum]MBK1696911.1 hypothetical protein [Rhodovibrio salinarum]